MNTYERRFAASIKELERNNRFRREVMLFAALPFPYGALRKVGVKIRPPLYSGFLTNSVVNGTWFGFAWGLFMHVLVWRNDRPVTDQVASALVVGVMFGLVTAFRIKGQKRKLGISEWAALPQSGTSDIHDSS